MRPNEFICSDLHLGHERVIQYSNRPFKNAEEMDEELITRWNAKVPKRANVYYLGDFTFHRNTKQICDMIDRLHGRIHFIAGNHDKGILRKKEIRDKFVWIKDRHESTTQDGRKIVMDHYPMMTWNKGHHGSWMLHGHCHGSLPEVFAKMRHGKVVFENGEIVYMKTPRLDIGVDMHPNYEPFSYQEIVERMVGREYNTVDHH